MTKYCVTFRFHNTGQLSTAKYDSSTERVIAIIGYGQYADVVDTWEESEEYIDASDA